MPLALLEQTSNGLSVSESRSTLETSTGPSANARKPVRFRRTSKGLSANARKPLDAHPFSCWERCLNQTLGRLGERSPNETRRQDYSAFPFYQNQRRRSFSFKDRFLLKIKELESNSSYRIIVRVTHLRKWGRWARDNTIVKRPLVFSCEPVGIP